MNRYIYLMIVAMMVLAGCGRAAQSGAQVRPTAQPKAVQVAFDADSAFAYVAAQTAFGPRVPNSEAHRRCGDWLVAKLAELGAANIVEQPVQLRACDGTMLDARNITAQINPSARKRVLLLAHWDSRPWADHDPDPSRRSTPIDGANDGASGVGVILEIARQLAAKAPSVGVDLLLTDAEDYGSPADQDDVEESWCLGTQHWVENPTVDLSLVRYAVLLDMVGGRDATFAREYFSQSAARDINDKVWRAAEAAGHADRFNERSGIPVIDDHIYLLRAGVPAVDIIETVPGASFSPVWHTHADNIDNIDPATLEAVGRTLLQLIYSE